MQPPGDNETWVNHQISDTDSDVLPSYMFATNTQHVLHLSKHGIPWLTLKLASCARFPEQMPLYIGQSAVEGMVVLNLSKPINVASIDIHVRQLLSVRL
jgi:hypothetical protein